MESGSTGVFTCHYRDGTKIYFAVLDDEMFFDIDSQPVVDIQHQPDLTDKKGAWEVIHDQLHIVDCDCDSNCKGTLIFLNAFSVQDAEGAGVIFDDEIKAYREEQGWKRPESWEYTRFEPEEEEELWREEEEGSYDLHNIKQFGICFPCTTDEDIIKGSSDADDRAETTADAKDGASMIVRAKYIYEQSRGPI
tara:strand:+ start:120 stop:698 length:579 start_codon:yes stop_codon:yes gene_type:complete